MQDADKTRKKILRKMRQDGREMTQKEFQKILDVVLPASIKGVVGAIDSLDSVQSEARKTSLQSTSSLSSEERESLADPRTGQLPLLYSDFSCSANTFLRSAIFTATPPRKNRTFYEDFTPIVAWEKDVTVRLQGKILTQYHHQVFLVILKAYSDQGLTFDQTLSIPTYSLLQMMGVKSIQPHYYRKLRDAIESLASSTLQIQAYWVRLTGSLLSSVKQDSKSKRWLIRLNPDLVPLFQERMFSYVHLPDHLALKSSLSCWLHLFVVSNDYPTICMKIERLYQLCGAQCKHLRTFREQLRTSLKELEDAQIIRKNWSVKDGMVAFAKRRKAKRITSTSQDF